MIPERMDVFKSVHKGLRKALFNLALQAGITDPDRPDEVSALSAQAKEVFHFLEHHARNEDRFLVPMMEARSLAPASRMRTDHAHLDAEVESLRRGLDGLGGLAGSPSRLHGFYLALNRFIARYLAHLNEEESEILPLLHAAFTDAELGEFSRQSVAATAPPDQAMMLGHMFPAMQAPELSAFFDNLRSKAPKEAVEYLEGIAKRVLGARSVAIMPVAD